MELKIRTGESGDLAALLELYQHLHATDTALPAFSRLQQVWHEIVDDPKIHCLMGEVDGLLVTSCMLIIVPNLTRGARSYGLIENVVTHGAYRRNGFGTRILHHALATAWQHNCYKVMLLTGRHDEDVYRFYQGAGFVRGIKTGFIATPDNVFVYQDTGRG